MKIFCLKYGKIQMYILYSSRLLQNAQLKLIIKEMKDEMENLNHQFDQVSEASQHVSAQSFPRIFMILTLFCVKHVSAVDTEDRLKQALHKQLMDKLRKQKTNSDNLLRENQLLLQQSAILQAQLDRAKNRPDSITRATQTRGTMILFLS